MKTLACALPLLLLCGCATMFRGSRQNVTIRTVPDHSAVSVDSVGYGPAPVSVPMRRGRTHTVTVSREGYSPQTVTMDSDLDGQWVLVDLFGGPISVLMDLSSKAWESFQKVRYVTLEAIPGFEPVVAAEPVVAPAVAVVPTRNGQVLVHSGQVFAFEGLGGEIRPKILFGWHQRDLVLRLDGLQASPNRLGPFVPDLKPLHEGSLIYVRDARGAMVALSVRRIEPKEAVLEWVRP